jgi:AcrR family transcriptional regulator
MIGAHETSGRSGAAPRIWEDEVTHDASSIAEGGDPATRIRLLDAAIHIASTQGLDKVTYRSVAAQAGLSHSLVRFYFGTGEAMITQALERAAQLDIDEAKIVSESVEEFGRDFLAVLEGERQRGMLQFDYLLRAVRGGLPVERVTGLYDVYIGGVSKTLDKVGIDDPTGAIAGLVLAAVDGMLLQHAIYNDVERTERLVEQLREVLRLLRVRPD